MADWIILDKTTGIGSDEVTITVSSYSELVERLKNLVFTTTDNKASDTCVVRQFGKSRYLLVEPSTVIASYTGGEVEARVIASEAWTIGNLPSWASCNATGGGAGTKTVRFTVQPNTGDIRKWNVYFLATEGLEATLELKQTKYGQSGYLEVNPSSINMVYGGGYVDVTVSSTEDWTIGGLPSWITCNSLGGKKGDTVIRLTISANTATSDRSYNISFTSANYNATLNVKQAKYEEGGIVPPEINPDDCEGGTFTVRITGDGCWSFTDDIPISCPICEDAFVYGTYARQSLTGITSDIRINEKEYIPIVDGINWALCSWTGGTLTNLRDCLNNDNEKYKQYYAVRFSKDFDTSNVKRMDGMFNACFSLTTVDLSNFNTSKVTDMSGMFNYCTSLPTIDLSNFDTSNVTDMGRMFGFCQSLITLDLSNFNTGKVEDMHGMFYYCDELASLDVSSFNTSNVTDMSVMFYKCKSLTKLDLSNFNTSKVENMRGMFNVCSSLKSLDVSSFNTSNVTNMGSMFQACYSLTTVDLSNFNTSNVMNMAHMFRNCSFLVSLDLSNFDTSKVRDINFMFDGDESLTILDLSNWVLNDIIGSTDYMFRNCNSLTTVKVINCNSSTQQKILYSLQTDLPSYTWTLSNGIITRS